MTKNSENGVQFQNLDSDLSELNVHKVSCPVYPYMYM